MRHRGYLLPLLAAVGIGLIGWFAAPSWMDALARGILAYDLGAIAMLILEWTVAMKSDPATTRRRAAVVDPGRVAVTGVVLVSSAAGLIGAVAILGLGGHGAGAARNVAYVLALSAVVLGWLMIHTAFTFRYAHLYYRDADAVPGPDRGLKFPGKEQPNDFDFAYFSFVLGMTFQVSDVQITSRRIRRIALAHALIAFAYNASIFALTVNVLASLLKGG
ncbi:MAG: DUF1345 domain-containing protein [Candidatus Eremiobacteraeota bacterium]|nr:DUF1345 domain-containing protein [Candidatus Eremiobacteraeota bacterium]